VVALVGLAIAHRHTGRLDNAAACAGRALSLARRIGYRILQGEALTALAAVDLDLDLPGRAIDRAGEALTIHRETGHRLGEARALLVLGHAEHSAGEHSAAVGHWRQALALFADIGAPEADDVRTLVPGGY
jgi:tetratricopeptide (TPR) repeat protein